MNRRGFLKQSSLLASGALLALTRTDGMSQQEPLSGQGETGQLRDPYSVGRSRDRATAADNDEAVKNIERQLKCSCGCSLDIFTCRTTDFTCETSPRLHKQVLGLYQGGFSDTQIVQQFVDQYGEQALMAPRPEGFNLAGYIVPGIAMMTAASLLTIYLTRRKKVELADAPAGPVLATQPPVMASATAAELEEVQRAVRLDDE
jgi:cytochrome c-type biogenesis protein CcmH